MSICADSCKEARDEKTKYQRAIDHEKHQREVQTKKPMAIKRARQPANQEKLRANSARTHTAQASILQLPVDKSTPCENLFSNVVGKCTRGTECRCDHSFLGTPEAIVLIPADSHGERKGNVSKEKNEFTPTPDPLLPTAHPQQSPQYSHVSEAADERPSCSTDILPPLPPLLQP